MSISTRGEVIKRAIELLDEFVTKNCSNESESEKENIKSEILIGLLEQLEILELLNPELDNVLRQQGLEYDIRVDGFRAMKGYWSKNDALAFAAWAIDCYKEQENSAKKECK